jgi:DNA-binding response OmpR family regulator
VRILLIEDDLHLGAALYRSLGLEGFDSLWVRRLKDARAHIEARLPAAMVLDINLPDGEGFTLLEALRRDDVQTPVIIMTARGSLDDRLRGLNGGADDYIAKPFAVPELIARIHAVIRRAAGHASPQWEVGALKIDVAGQMVWIDGVEVELTPTEFKLVVALARNAGRIVGREELIARVWSDGAESSDAALDYQIHALRRKLGAARIVTRRGRGFRLEVQ